MGENLTVNLKVRLTSRDDLALMTLASRKRQKKGAIARTAIVEFLEREEAEPSSPLTEVTVQTNPDGSATARV